MSETFSEPAALRPYANYRSVDTGLIRCVPAHWKMVLAKHVAQVTFSSVDKHTVEGETSVRLCNYVDVYKNAAIRTGHPFMSASATPEEIDRFSLRAGDVLLTKDSEAWNDIGIPALIGEDLPGVLCGYHLAMLRPDPRAALGAYLYWALLAPSAAVQFHVAASGVTRYGLSKGDVKNVALPLPPLAEQAAIARYLGHFDAKVGRLLRAKRRLVALLTEQKQAVIQQAVTRGLDPDVPLRDSGVPWLGAVPAHWEVIPVGRLLDKIDQGWSPVAAEGDVRDEQWMVLTLAAVRRGRFDATATKPISLIADVPARLEIHDGDLLLTRANTRDRVGDCCIVVRPQPRTIFSDLIYRLRVRTGTAPEYLALVLLSGIGRAQIERDARGSSGSMPKITQRHIRSWRICVPPISEQGAIIESVHTELARLDRVLDRVACEIDLIREYRTRLVADVVTGQLDVRDAAAGLPEFDALAEEAGWDAAGEDAGEDGALPDDAGEAEADDADD